ncbi:MAG: hypothetical protein DMD81_17495 [Candidatus Rokuibacteriota bacterium]|nr:MAG: hypothetical protein DMD81_17495 [Candidatus Rokubacteria bacterium]
MSYLVLAIARSFAVGHGWRRFRGSRSPSVLPRVGSSAPIAARVSTSSRLDPAQAVRLQRILLASAASAVTAGMTLLVAWVGGISGTAAATYTVAVTTMCAVAYLLVRSNLNLHFRDPGLSGPLLTAAGLSVSYVAYEGEQARPAFIAMYLLAYMFAILSLRARGLVWTAMFYVACYAGVVALSSLVRPASTDLRRESFRIVALAIMLGWMTILGNYVGGLRRNLRQANDRLRQALARTEILASEDPLTGCHNRRHVMELLALEIKRNSRGSAISVGLVDIDDFKTVNDTCGHHAGDLVMKEVTEITRATLRATDFFGRYGGDEFLIGFSQTTFANAQHVVERVRRMVADRAFSGVPPGRQVTVSIGVAEYRRFETIDDLLSRADAALYEAKRQGRNRVV